MKTTKSLIAIKPFSYNTRRLHAGDIFEARSTDARLLVAVKKARSLEEREEEIIPTPSKDLVSSLLTLPIISDDTEKEPKPRTRRTRGRRK